ncbi:hypothetical protein Tco_0972374 [Tanacetum coccineum]
MDNFPECFPEPKHNWANAIHLHIYSFPLGKLAQKEDVSILVIHQMFCRRMEKEKLCIMIRRTTFNLVKAFHKNSVFLQYQMDECHKLLTNKVDLSNPEGHQILRNIYEPLPLGGPPGQVTIQPQFFFNRDLDYLLTGDKERRIALSISKLKAARYLDFGLEELVPSLWKSSTTSARHDKTSLPHCRQTCGLRKLVIRESCGRLCNSGLKAIKQRAWETRKWSEDDKRRTKYFITAIEKDYR